jgi:hypothetical protein
MLKFQQKTMKTLEKVLECKKNIFIGPLRRKLVLEASDFMGSKAQD